VLVKEISMDQLSSSLSDRVNYDEVACVRAREYLRAAEIPIDPEKMARYIMQLEGLPESDDPVEAEARYTAKCTRRCFATR